MVIIISTSDNEDDYFAGVMTRWSDGGAGRAAPLVDGGTLGCIQDACARRAKERTL